MTDEQLQEIRDRLAKATPGPWSVMALNSILRHARKSSGYWDDIRDDYPDDSGIYPEDGPDADFIANAPTDIAKLLEEVQVLQTSNRALKFIRGEYGKECKKLREALEHICEYWNGSETNGAMSDALHEILHTAHKALGR